MAKKKNTVIPKKTIKVGGKNYAKLVQSVEKAYINGRIKSFKKKYPNGRHRVVKIYSTYVLYTRKRK